LADAIIVEGLRFAYPPILPGEPAPWVLDSVDLRVGAGEWLAVMGPSDAGKTTLCLLLAALAPHITRGALEGRVLVQGRDTRDHPPPALADRVGYVFQDPDAQLFNSTVEAEVAWGLENLGLPVAEIRKRIDETLAFFGLEAARYRAPGELSGGEKKRLALASVLAMDPSVLILDEPIGGLDPSGRAQVLKALAGLRKKRPVTIVMTESDPEAVAAFADRLIVLHQGRIAAQGTPRDLFLRSELNRFGVSVPQMARLAATLNRELGTAFDFLSTDEARQSLAVHLG